MARALPRLTTTTTCSRSCPHGRCQCRSRPPASPCRHPEGSRFDRTREAGWLADRILTSCDGTLLAHLAQHRPQTTSSSPWSDPATLTAPPEARTLLEHAQVFSLLVHGAALLYNLLLDERYVDEGFAGLDDRPERYRERLAAWEARREQLAPVLAHWSYPGFLALVQHRNHSVLPRTWSFFRGWSELASAEPMHLADSPEARTFIERRERDHKAGQSRLRNRGLLRSWSGSAGAGALTFRWDAVRRILLDIHEGLERGDA